MAPIALESNGFANGANGHAPAMEYRVKEAHLGDATRKVRVIFVGAGFSGINFDHHAQKLPWLDYTIYEKNKDVAGTWLENRYPGAACDIPSPAYSFLFNTTAEWPRFYSAAADIRQYLVDTAKAIGAYNRIRLGKKVIDARWDGERGKWTVKVEHVDSGEVTTDECDLIVNGGGYLSNWRWPDIAGLHSFSGPVMHSANWDESVSLKGKRVAVVGAGSSAIQIVPAIIDEVSHLYSFNRSRTYIFPGLCADMTPDNSGRNFHYSDEEKQRMRDDPVYMLKQRKRVETALQSMYQGFQRSSEEQKAWRQEGVELMKKRLGGNQDLIDRMIPNFEAGCRRPTPGEGYLEALIRPNATLVTDKIECVTPKGIRTVDGTEHEVDVIVCATGFDTSFAPRWNVIGTNPATTLRKDMLEKPRVYMGVSVANYPNFFNIFGAFSPTAHGSAVPGIDAYVRYILQIAEKMAKENVKTVAIKPKVVDDFLKHVEAWMPRAVWTGSCNSWYKTQKNPVPTLYPGTYPHILEVLKAPRYEHYDFEYLDDGNACAFMGNGFLRIEIEGGDLTPYLNPYIEAAEQARAAKKLKV